MHFSNKPECYIFLSPLLEDDVIKFATASSICLTAEGKLRKFLLAFHLQLLPDISYKNFNMLIVLYRITSSLYYLLLNLL